MAYNYGPQGQTVILYEYTNDVKNDPIASFINKLRIERRSAICRTMANYEIEAQRKREESKQKRS